MVCIQDLPQVSPDFFEIQSSFSLIKTCRAAIFQLATKEAGVFVIDLEPDVDADKQAVINFLSTFFHDKQVMKIGMDFTVLFEFKDYR
jgi:hypothetical protein